MAKLNLRTHSRFTFFFIQKATFIFYHLCLTLLYNGILANRLRFQRARWNKGHRVQEEEWGGGGPEIIKRPSIPRGKKCSRRSRCK